MIIVSLTAGTLIAGYGLINYFSSKGADKEAEIKTVAEQTGTKTPETETGTSTVAVISDIEEDKTAEETPEGGEIAKKTDEANQTEKSEMKELVTFSAKEAEKYFKDTAFIGDSRTQGLQINAGIRSPKFFAGRGLNVKNALTDKVVKGKGKENLTVIEALEGKEYKKIYISFGINELGWTYPDIFIKRYKELIEEVQKKQPKAEVVVYGILPVTKKRSDKDKIFNMKNVKKFNKLIKEMAKDVSVTYADLSASVKNKKGFLPDEVTPDGIHMNREYCRRILAYIANKKI